MSLLKALAIAFFVMAQTLLIICFMEVGDELNHTDFILYGIMICVACTGCIGAAVGVSMINSKG